MRMLRPPGFFASARSKLREVSITFFIVISV